MLGLFKDSPRLIIVPSAYILVLLLALSEKRSSVCRFVAGVFKLFIASDASYVW